MIKLTVVDPGTEDIAGKIAARLGASCGEAEGLLLRKANSYSELNGLTADVLVITSDAAMLLREPSVHMPCGILLFPGDHAPGCEAAEGFEAGCIVTYGMSPKNTITLSSIGEESCVLALQRELMTVKGNVLERQEMCVKGGMRPDSLLAVVGALLLTGLRLSDANR